MSDTYWEYPGIPSLVVPYGNTADYYYSGHTGFTLMTTVYMYQKGHYFCSALGVFVFFYIIHILVLFKVHYSIGKFVSTYFTDIAIGMFSGAYAYYFGIKFTPFIEYFFKNIIYKPIEGCILEMLKKTKDEK